MGRARRADVDTAAEVDDTTCKVCGRRMPSKAKWAGQRDQVRHCSAACSRRGLTAADLALEEAIHGLLLARARSATICPSEAARQVAAATPTRRGNAAATADDAERAWRDLMEPARMAARRMVARGEVEILQKGRPVDPSTAKGPVRIRRSR